MKYLIFVALIASSTSALSDTISGCEVVKADNGNYFYKVDASCKFERIGLDEQGEGKNKLPSE